MTAGVQVQGAGKRYRRGWALRDCDLVVPPSSVTALIGPNGAGKSTLLAAAAGLVTLTSGRISVGGRVVVGRLDPEAGYLAQDKPLFRRWRVAEVIAQAADLNGPAFDIAHTRQLADEAGLASSARVGTLSGGQRTRLALALVLGRRPALVLLDEPLADLDPLARLEIRQTLMAEVARSGLTVLLSSHILTEVQDTCDRLALLQDGRVTLAGEVDALVDAHRMLAGPAHDSLDWLPVSDRIEVRSTSRQTIVLVSAVPAVLPTRWTEEPVELDEIIIARLRTARAAAEAA